MTGIDWNMAFALQILPSLLYGAIWTLTATVASFVVAMILGIGVALLCDGRRKIVSWPSRAIVDFIRGTPILIQLYLLYFALPAIGLTLPAIVVGILTLSVHYACYMSDTYRAGLATVAKGQREAASSLGLRRGQTFFLVVLPQAIRPIIPMLGNYLIFLFKETPLLSAVAIVELLQTAKLIGSDTFRYTEPFTLVGIIFLVLSLGTAWLLARLEKRLARQRR
ncbi:ectoine/hydroxyectoine ABC transporter permease subunit EhuD [Labrys okinawensis]|uniref:ectoine/hydroxyectoine ABC transporter permease subunit EhuD n=1 Tax=Labrys okinawensis TaxID=346911 RepID=UPI0039BCDBFE